jgi:hypothetical protein
MGDLRDDAEQYAAATVPLAKRNQEWPLHRLLERSYLAGTRNGAHKTMRIFMECCNGKIDPTVLGEVMDRLTKEDLL